MRKKERFATRDQVRGCLIGGAVGDALGYPVEFMSYDSIVGKYGKGGIRDMVLRAEGVAEISDDTQMALFTATGLLFGSTRSKTHGVCGNPEDYVRYHYMDWYRTQTMRYEDALAMDRNDSWLTRDRRFYQRRSPGNTCLEALNAITNGRDVENFSKGCGGVMRVAPVAIFNDLEFCNDTMMGVIAAQCAEITHHHFLSSISSAALVMLINRIVRSGCKPEFYQLAEIVKKVSFDAQNTPRGYSKEAETYYQANPRLCEELYGVLNHAITLAEDRSMTDEECIRQIGGGWVAEEALAIAVFCMLRHPDSFEEAVIAAVNHDGDSDSTGAICGNIMGALLGEKAIPERFTRNLELIDVISELSDDLYMGCRIAEYGPIEEISKKEESEWITKYLECESIHNDFRRRR